MHILNYIILVAAFCLIPAGVLWLCGKIKILGKIGPVLVLYLIGIIMGNIGLMPDELPAVQEIMSNAMIPLAIPLMLFSCTFRKSETRSQLLAMITGLVAVVIAVVAGYFIFGTKIDEGAKVGGMMTGVYTGGTVNLAALKLMLGVKDETYILMNTYDMIISFLYLTFLLAFGIRLFRKFLPNETNRRLNYVNADGTKNNTGAEHLEDRNGAEEFSPHPYKGLFTSNGMKNAGIALGITLIICAIAGGLAILMPQGAFMVVFILVLTTLGIACSFNRKIRNLKYSFDIGMYFIYIFCIAVASMADLSKLNIAGGMNLLGYLLVAVFGSLLIQVLLARIFKIDSDTAVIASVSFINSPPFVPMIAAAMKNRNVIVAGLSIGIIGYAVGNYLGYLIYQLLNLL